MRLIDADALYETLITGDIRETHQFCYPCKKVLEAIDAQPTVEAISRQQAIDALGDMVMNWTDSDYELGQLNQWKADRKAIIDLPSAQPQSTMGQVTDAVQSTKDCISRQDAIDALFGLYEYQRDIDPTEAADLVRQGIYLAEKKIEQLPSAQPQRIKGKWERKESDLSWWYECSECGESPLFDPYENEVRTPFCPWCGADMRGEEDG